MLEQSRSKRQAESGQVPAFEQIMREPDQSFRCLTHDYPCELARWNYHPEHEIHLIRQSSGHVFVGDYIGTFAPGHLAFVNSNIPHNWVTESSDERVIPDRDLVIQFGPELIRRAGEAFPEFRFRPFPADAFSRSWQYQGETARRGAQLMEEVLTSTGLMKLARFLELLDCLGSSSERLPLATHDYIPTMDERSSDLVHQAISLVLETLPGDVRMTEIADRLGMSATAFSRFFKHNTGHNFVDYLRKLRITQACRLLSESQMPITDICFSVGYTNFSNFNRNFRNERGLTPREYRRRSRAKAT